MKLCIVFLFDKLNEWFLEFWWDHFQKYNVPVICLIECCSQQSYDSMLKKGIECYFWGRPWSGSETRNYIIDIVRRKYNPEWILLTHADEIFENRMIKEIELLMNDQKYCWYRFPIYHHYESMTHYRNDGVWQGGKMDVMRLWKNNILKEYKFGGPGQVHHVQSMPNGMNELPGIRTNIRVKHFGHANKGSWQSKCFIRGKDWGQVGNLEHIELVEWKE